MLSNIYWMLTKFLLYKIDYKNMDKYMESCQIFQDKFGESVLKDAINILDKNLKREIDDPDDEYEKITLSLSIVNFIKACSAENA